MTNNAPHLALRKRTPTILLSLTALVPICAAATAIPCLGGESSLPQLGRAPEEVVVAALSPREQVGLIVGDGRFLLVEDPAKAGKGVGMVIENGKSLPAVPRLSIFTSVFSDGPAGVNQHPLPPGATAPLYTTAFPIASCLAASWDVDVLQRVGEAIGDELLAYGNDHDRLQQGERLLRTREPGFVADDCPR